MAKVVKNLSLDAEAVKLGEKFSKRKGTTISRIVSDFLLRLDYEADTPHAPAVARLLGIAKGKGDLADYHEYLEKKYGR
jgi:hypothetical protein